MLVILRRVLYDFYFYRIDLVMRFVDRVKVFVSSGKGGDGCVSFRRERHVPKGGPNGGDGGDGGSILIRAVAGLNTLADFNRKRHFRAESGRSGEGRMRSGKRGQDMILEVPCGTQVLSEDETMIIADLVVAGEYYVAARGGSGGFGNTRFKSSTNRAPRRRVKGEEGEEFWYYLKLKSLADVGLVGLPNSGKSTFLRYCSASKAKVGDYSFTTLYPNLGLVDNGEERFVMADIPGLIHGASKNLGLGHRFLGHVERCKILLHIVDLTEIDPLKNWKIIRKELREINEELAEKQELVILNKSDQVPDDCAEEYERIFHQETKQKVWVVSGIRGDGMKELIGHVFSCVSQPGSRELEEWYP